MKSAENTDRSNPFTFEELDYSIEPDAKDDVQKLITDTLYGVNGGLRYRHKNALDRLENLGPSDFIVGRLDGMAAGNTTYCKRPLLLDDKKHDGYYVRYFSVGEAYRSKGVGTHITTFADNHYRNILVNPSVFYAYIELENIRSMKVSDHRLVQKVGQFKTTFFSRFFPKKQTGCGQIKEEEKSNLLNNLKAQYAQHVFVNLEKVFHNDNYFVLRKNGEIVAGAQINKVAWVIEQIPGFSGWMTMKLIPHLPILKRLSNPKNYQFTTFEGIYCKEGHEADLFKLFEHALAEQGTYTGMFWFDPQCPVYSRIKGKGDLGFLGKVQKSPLASIVGEFLHVTDEEIELYKKRPVYISAFDLT